MHLGFALCLRLGTFFYVCVTAVVVLFPSWFWDEVVFAYLRRNPQWEKMELYYIPKKREGTRLYELSCKLIGNLFLMPESQVRPIDRIHLPASEVGGSFAGGNRELGEASVVAIDSKGIPAIEKTKQILLTSNKNKNRQSILRLSSPHSGMPSISYSLAHGIGAALYALLPYCIPFL